ncbi:Transposase IS4 [Popillia japonica]|uniref:Transposase IS4 n=1 Tax=Popillia japonica TaxID=7064 RepID=A0AAW1JIM0_POPJA
MDKKYLTDKKLAGEWENISQELAEEMENISEEGGGDYSDDSIADRTYVPIEKSSDEELEQSKVSDYESDDSGDTSNEDSDDNNEIKLAAVVKARRWEPVDGNRLTFNVTPQNTGVHPNVAAALAGKKPVGFFNHFIDDDVILFFVTETNRFAAHAIAAANNSGNQTQKARLSKCTDTNPEEMQKFLGIVIWMTLLSQFQLRDYWSKLSLQQ